MPLSPDRRQPVPRRLHLAVAALIAAGYGLTLAIFYPGIMTYDAKFVHEDIAKGVLGDWQSPVMTVLWGVIDPIAPGPGSMFLLIATSYWLGFGLLAFALARRSSRLALLLPLLALTPPAFVFVGIIWRDVLFATTWLLAAAIVFAAAERGARFRMLVQVLALALCAFGVLLRPNALIAAPILAAYIAWPTQMSWKRTAILFVPAMAGFFALVQVVYYGALGATRQHPLQSIMVFDLGGISHFTRQNQFPVTWSEPESALLLNSCYQPTQWDIYWRLEPCDFVMRKVEREEKLFGTPAITEAWAHAVMRHPFAYLRHRSAFMWNFLAGDNMTMWLADVERPTATVFPDRPAFAGTGLAARQAQADAAVPGGFVAAGLHRRVRVRLAATRRRPKAPSRSAFADRLPSMCSASLPSASRRISGTAIGRSLPASRVGPSPRWAGRRFACHELRLRVPRSSSCSRLPRHWAIFSGTRRSARSPRPWRRPARSSACPSC